MTSTANSNTFKSHSLYVQAICVKLLSIRRQIKVCRQNRSLPGQLVHVKLVPESQTLNSSTPIRRLGTLHRKKRANCFFFFNTAAYGVRIHLDSNGFGSNEALK